MELNTKTLIRVGGRAKGVADVSDDMGQLNKRETTKGKLEILLYRALLRDGRREKRQWVGVGHEDGSLEL